MSYLSEFIAEKQTLVERTRDEMHEYQRTAVQFLRNNPFSALFIDLGLGKSVISLTTILDLVCDFELDNALVVAPIKVAKNTWPDELQIWEHTTALTAKQIRTKELVKAVNEAGQNARKEAKLRKLGKLDTEKLIDKARRITSKKLLKADFVNSRAHVQLINREQIEWLVDSWGRDFPYKVVFVDESDSLKDHRTNRFKALARVRPMLTRLHELTATPSTETYLHLFAQIYLLDMGERLGRSYTAYKDEYFITDQYTYEVKLRKGAAEAIAEKISDICLTMKQEDYLSLKECVFQTDVVELPTAALKLYKQMESEYVIALPSGVEVEAETAAALSQKLLQMSSGVVYDTKKEEQPDGTIKFIRDVHHLHDGKIHKLREIVDSTDGERIIVAYWHKSSLDRLKKHFPNATVMDKQGDAIAKWNRGEIEMLLLHPASSGHGLNIQKGGRRLVFFDIPWSLGLYLQLVGRLARQGQQLKVIVHHIVAKGTIDEDVVKCLIAKEDLQNMLFRLLKLFRKKLSKGL